MRRQLLSFILIFLLVSPALAVTKTSARAGRWDAASTWTPSGVPAATDDCIIADDTVVVWDGVADAALECDSLVINVGGQLNIVELGVLDIGGNGDGTPGGVDVSGVLSIGGGTLRIDPDGNDDAQEDGVRVLSGGFLDVTGLLRHKGSISAMTVPDDGDTIDNTLVACTDIVFLDRSLSLNDCASVAACDAVTIFISGERRTRWYDVITIGSGTVTLDCDSRFNNERRGQPIYTTGTVAGVVSGTTVTGVATDWHKDGSGSCGSSPCDYSVGGGSLFWCDDDTFLTEATRIQRIDSDTTLTLSENYKGTGTCAAGAYNILDLNEPYTAVSVHEQVAPGDEYVIIKPSIIESKTGTEATLDEQIYVQVQAGAGFRWRGVSFKWVGSEQMVTNQGWGVQVFGFDGAGLDDPLMWIEVSECAGEGCLYFSDVSNLDVQYAYVHWVNPAIDLTSSSNEGHGIHLQGTSDNVRIQHSRADRLGDDGFWWDGNYTGTSGVYDSVVKYLPTLTRGRSVDGIDVTPPTAASQLRIENNVVTNIGGFDSQNAACYSVGVPIIEFWTGQGAVVRNNLCLNIQMGMFYAGQGPGPIVMKRNNVWWVNNIGAFGNLGAARRLDNAYQNTYIEWNAADGSAFVNGLLDTGTFRSNIMIQREGTAETRAMRIAFNSADTIWTGTTVIVEHNIVAELTNQGINLSDYSATGRLAVGQSQITNNVIAGTSTANGGVTIYSFSSSGTGADGGLEDTALKNNIFDNLVSDGARGGNLGAAPPALPSPNVDSNICNRNRTECFTGYSLDINTLESSTGINPGARDFELVPQSQAFTFTTTDGELPGPHFAGTLRNKIPFNFLVPNLPRIVNPTNDWVDTDGDGLINFWDNCDFQVNLGWVDSNNDGIGDACQR